MLDQTNLWLSEVEVGSHFYWYIGDNSIHGETIIVTLMVFVGLIILSLLGTRGLSKIPFGFQNFVEFIVEFIEGVAKAQLGESFYREWISFVGTIFLFIFFSNWLGALVPWKLLVLPEGELAAPTNDINTTTALALLTSLAYFFAGFKTKGLGYFRRYISPTPILLPINILEDFTKPLSLSFRLFGNVLADELTVNVIGSLVPLFIPVPIMILGIFASSIQALIFSTLAASYVAESLE
mmetsp:Transcript_1694/g.5866  ORF Transcript_1694/g.5866 Transcript_1694/m.5866 type:complete len:238 (+) Transcript_1694:1574-2287(+)